MVLGYAGLSIVVGFKDMAQLVGCSSFLIFL